MARLSPSAERFLGLVRRKLEAGFTGRWEVEVHEGGIRAFQETIRPELDPPGIVDLEGVEGVESR